MALIRALNTAVAGLKSQQFRIETVGNNIANVDTTAYKSNRTEFNTLLSQMYTAGVAPQGHLGGIDPIQLGLGVQVAASTTNWNQGSVKMTGVSSDLAINGDGFFTVKDAGGNLVYTRDGSFTINPANLLHDPATGYIVQGWGVDSDFNIVSGGPLMDLEIPVGTLNIARATEMSQIEGNLNSAGAMASNGSWLATEVLYDNRVTNTDLITSDNPLGLARATADTPLENLVRSLGDYVPTTGGSAGTAATAVMVFPDLAQQSTGLEITVGADKGSRMLQSQTFVVGDPPPKGGVTLGDFMGFLQNTLGVCDGYYDGLRQAEETYSFARHNPVTGEEINGTISAGMNGGADDSASLTSIVDHQADFRGVQVGDYIRFTSGTASGEIAEVIGISASTPGGPLDTLSFRSGTFNTLGVVPTFGDTYVIHAPAGVGLDTDTQMTQIDGTSATVTVGGVSTTGSVSTFTLTDTAVTDFAQEHGLAIGQQVSYLSGGAEVTGQVTSVNGDTVSISYNSSLTRPPDAGATFTVTDLADGTIAIAGNVASENEIGNIEITAGDSRISLFDGAARRHAEGESVTTRLTVYDSLGTARQVELTFVFQSSTNNGPNVFRYYAECLDDSSGNPVVGTGVVMFGPDGQFLGTGSAEETISIDLNAGPGNPGGAVSPFVFQVDMSRMTQLADTQSQVIEKYQDGFESGTLDGFSVDLDGTVVGSFSNGEIRNLGQVVLTRFANPSGLKDLGENVYKTAPNSGIPQLGTAGTGGRGWVRGGYLEESNVDLAEQFTELIIGQRAFQANARTVTTSNELLQELVNLI